MNNLVDMSDKELEEKLKEVANQFVNAVKEQGWKYSEQINVLQQERFLRSNTKVISNLNNLEKSIITLNISITGLHDDINKSNKGAWYLSMVALLISLIAVSFSVWNSWGDNKWKTTLLTKMDGINTTILNLETK
jgi:hypothetical protein